MCLGFTIRMSEGGGDNEVKGEYIVVTFRLFRHPLSFPFNTYDYG